MNRTACIVFALAASFAACGDDTAGTTADASVDAPSFPEDVNTPRGTAVVVSGDFQSGSGIASTIAIPELTVQTNAVAGVVSSDPVIRSLGDRVVVVNRFGADNISVLEAADLSLIEQVPTGANSNPQDVARFGGKLYVVSYATNGVSIIDESDLNGGVVATIDLSANDPDGFPNCASIAVANDKLFVSCQILDNATFLPRGPGIVAVIDPSTDQVLDTLTLRNANPFSFLLATPASSGFGGDVLVATVPDFASYAAGCIERISTGDTPAVGDCLITNDSLGGYVSDLEVSGNGIIATVTTCVNGNCFGEPSRSDVARINGSGQVTTTFATDSSHPTDLAVCPGGEILAGDTDYADSPGIRVYAADGTELTTAPLDIGLPPAFTNALSCY